MARVRPVAQPDKRLSCLAERRRPRHLVSFVHGQDLGAASALGLRGDPASIPGCSPCCSPWHDQDQLKAEHPPPLPGPLEDQVWGASVQPALPAGLFLLCPVQILHPSDDSTSLHTRVTLVPLSG